MTKNIELFKFVKDRELKQDHVITYHAGDIKELTSKVELSAGVSIVNSLFQSAFTFGFKGFRTWYRKRIDKVDISHRIEGDQYPRMIYLVYKLGKPLSGAKLKEDTIEGQTSMIERLFTEHRKYPRFHHKSVHQQFMFYACIQMDDTNSHQWPDTFLIGESNLKSSSLHQDLKLWHILDPDSKIKVNASNVYFKFKRLPTQVSNDKMMIYAYLNAIRKTQCLNCSHDWTLCDFWDLLECKKRMNQRIGIVLSDEGYKLQKKHQCCGLWTYYFSTVVFMQKENVHSENGMFSTILNWF